MKSKMDFTLLLLAFLFSFIFIIIASVSGDEVVGFTVCSEPFDCGTKTNLSYPFWAAGYRARKCGHLGFELTGCGDRAQHPILSAGFPRLRLVAVNQSSKTLTVALSDLWNTTCPPIYGTGTLNFSLLQFTPPNPDAALQNLTLYYGCPLRRPSIPQTRLSCSIAGDSAGELVSFYANATFVRDKGLEGTLQSCRGSVEFPMPADVPNGIWGSDGESELRRVLDAGFNVSYDYGEYEASCDQCSRSNGLCGTAAEAPNFLCHCVAGPQPLLCPASGTYSNPIGLYLVALPTATVVFAP